MRRRGDNNPTSGGPSCRHLRIESVTPTPPRHPAISHIQGMPAWSFARPADHPSQPDSRRIPEVQAIPRGIYTDSETSEGLALDGGGRYRLALHTGKICADELSSDGLVYHHPETKQRGKDRSRDPGDQECCRITCAAVHHHNIGQSGISGRAVRLAGRMGRCRAPE
jgi:hypothetical protein